MEASFAHVVWSAFDRGWIGIYWRRGRKLYRARGCDGQTAVALPGGRVGLFVADGVCDRRERVRRSGRWLSAIYVRSAVIAIQMKRHTERLSATGFTRSESPLPSMHR